MNSTVTAAAKVIDELSQSNKNNGMKQDGIQNTKARSAESLKENGKTKYAWPGH
jgi:dsRNA-specific ribonuclease